MQAAGADEILARQIAAATVDFRDADHEPNPHGAEDTDYQALGKPLGTKNAPFAQAFRDWIGIVGSRTAYIEPGSRAI